MASSNIGLRETIDPSRKSIGNRNGFSPVFDSPSTSFFARMHFFQCCMLLQGTLGRDFDIFAASGGSTAWVLLWKHHSRPSSVRVCPVAQSDFFSTAFDPQWLCSGRKIKDVSLHLLHLKSEEEMRLALHHRQDLPLLMTMIFLLVEILNLFQHILDRQIRLDFHQDGLQLCGLQLHLLVRETE